MQICDYKWCKSATTSDANLRLQVMQVCDYMWCKSATTSDANLRLLVYRLSKMSYQPCFEGVQACARLHIPRRQCFHPPGQPVIDSQQVHVPSGGCWQVANDVHGQVWESSCWRTDDMERGCRLLVAFATLAMLAVLVHGCHVFTHAFPYSVQWPYVWWHVCQGVPRHGPACCVF